MVEAHILKSKRLNVLGFVSWVTSKAQNAQWVNKTFQKKCRVQHEASSLNKQNFFLASRWATSHHYANLFCASESCITELRKRRERGSPTDEAVKHLIVSRFPMVWTHHNLIFSICKRNHPLPSSCEDRKSLIWQVNCYLPGVSKRAEHWSLSLCTNSLLSRDESSWKWGRRAKSRQDKGTPVPSYAEPWL